MIVPKPTHVVIEPLPYNAIVNGIYIEKPVTNIKEGKVISVGKNVKGIAPDNIVCYKSNSLVEDNGLHFVEEDGILYVANKD